MTTKAKIVCYNYSAATSGCSDVSLCMYWGGSYKNVFYLDGDLGRPTFEDIIETVSNSTGQTTRTQNTSIERQCLSVLAISPLLQFLKTLDKHDVKQLIFTDTNKTFVIKNIDIDDEGDVLNPVQRVNIWFENEPISEISQSVVIKTTQKKAFFDNDDDGTQDIDGEAEFTGGTTGVFNTWQLYFESNGVTPATSGRVILKAYAVTSTGVESLIGLFRGIFTDLFSDSTLWQSSQNIWDYFNVADSVGHTNRIQFDKKAFAEDNGYSSSEQLDRAVDIRFELSIDGSTPQPTTLSKVYTVWGAFHSAGIQSAITGEYGYTTIGKVDGKNTLSTIADVRYPSAGGAATLITSAVLTTSTNYSSDYVLDVTDAGARSFEGSFTTKGGFVGSNFRGAYNNDNFTLSVDGASAVTQDLNILNFTLGTTPYDFTFDWKYDRQTGSGGFAILGDVVAAGDAKVLLDGVLVNTLPSIIPATLQVLGTQTVTLPDTAVHVVRLFVITSTSYTIFTEFEVQLKPLF